MGSSIDLEESLLRGLASAPEQAPPPVSLASERYQVLRVLGRGAQKVVLLVRDTALDRECALAIVRAERFDAVGLDRLRREARAVAGLGPHPHIVTVYDLGDDQNRPYIASEYLAGGDLRAALREAGGTLPTPRALAVARDVCRGLDFAHSHGIVHRDVKPENVLLSSGGSAKLGDFGLALAEGRTRLSKPGGVVGTASYIAPEQAQGRPVDGRTDLYALGCVLYEMVTGRPPFTGDDFVSVVSQHVHAPLVAARERNPSVPAAVDGLLLRLLAKVPSQRPSSAADVLRELEALALSPPSAESSSGEAEPLRALASTRFAGRTAELGQLKAALEEGLAGRGGFIAVGGEPGIGKSRLGEELCYYARLRGARVMAGHSSDAEGTPPYLPFIEALDGGLRGFSAESIDALLHGRGPLVARLLPQLAARLPAGPAAAETDRYVMFQAVSDLLRELAAASGLLLLLEDLHWADEPSQRLLQHVARRLEGSRLLIVVTFRDVEAGPRHLLREVLADLRRDRLCAQISLKGLSLEEIRCLTGEEQMPEPLARALLRETQGNPLFVSEVLKHLAEEGRIAWRRGLLTAGASFEGLGIPEGIRDVVERRLSRLGVEARQMLVVAAAIGASFAWDVLRAASDLEEDVLLDALDEALAAQIIRPQLGDRANRHEFIHGLIRQALYESVSGPRRAKLHRRIGEAIERVQGESALDELAWHYCQARTEGVADKAIACSIRAADRAAAVLAYEEVAVHCGRALEVTAGFPGSATADVVAAVHARRGSALANIGVWEEARKEFEAALSGTPEGEQRAQLLVELAMVCFWAQDVPSLRQYASEALLLAESLGRDDLAAGAQGALAAATSADGDVRSSIVEMRRAVTRAGGRKTPAIARGLQMCSLQLYWVGEYGDAIQLARDAAASARSVGDAFVLMAALPQLGLALAACGRYGEALDSFAEARRFGRDHHIGGFYARSIAMSAGLHFDLADHSGAESLVEEARELARGSNFPPTVLNARLDLLRIKVRQGKLADADKLVEEVRDDVAAAVAWHGWLWRLRFAQARAELALARGEAEEAHRLANDVIARSLATGRVKYEVEGLVAQALALEAMGRRDDAARDLKEAVALARRTGDPAAFLRTARELLRLREDESLAAEAGRAKAAIAGALPGGELRRRFLSL